MWSFRSRHASHSVELLQRHKSKKQFGAGFILYVRPRAIVGCVAGGRTDGRTRTLSRRRAGGNGGRISLAPLLHVAAHDCALGKLLEPLESIHLGTEEGGREGG